MESVECNTKKIFNEISRVFSFNFKSFDSRSSKRVFSRSTKPRRFAVEWLRIATISFVDILCELHKRIKNRQASLNGNQINEWKLVSRLERTFLWHYPTSVACLNRKLDSFVKCLFSTHFLQAFASSPPSTWPIAARSQRKGGLPVSEAFLSFVFLFFSFPKTGSTEKLDGKN